VAAGATTTDEVIHPRGGGSALMRLFLRLVILVPLALIAGGLFAVVIVVATVDPNDYRGHVADLLRDATGQPVALRGPLQWSLGLLTVSAEDVVVGDLASTAAGSLRIGKVEVAFAPIPLLAERRLQVRRLALSDAAIVLDVAARAPSAAAAAPSGAAAPQPAREAPQRTAGPRGFAGIEEIDFRNVGVTVRHRGRNRTWELMLARAEMHSRAPPLFEIGVEGIFSNVPFTAEGRSGGPIDLVSVAPWPVNLTLRVGDLGRVKVVGSIADALVAPRLDLTLTVDGPELRRLAALAGLNVPTLGAFRGEIKVGTNEAGMATVPSLDIAFGRPELVRVAVRGSIAEPEAQRGFDLRVSAEGGEIGALSAIATALGLGQAIPALGPFQVRAHVVDGSGGPRLDDLRMQVGRDGAIKLVAVGRIARPLARRGIALDVQLQAPDATQFARLVRLDVPLQGEATVQARISDPAPGRFRFENLRATLGPNDAAGDITLAFDGERPVLSGELASNRIDLASLGAGPRSGPSGDGRVFSDAPLPFDVVIGADADLRLRVVRIDGIAASLRDVTATVVLRNGDLAVRPFAGALAGGQVSGELAAAARGTVNVRLNGHNINMGALLREMQLSDQLDGGRAEYALDLRGTGRSLRAIMASANGSHSLIVRGGTVDNRFFEIIGADLVRWLAHMVGGAERPRLNCVVSRFDIRDGLATAHVLMFDTSQITAAGEGTINLGTEALALRLQPRPRNASLLSFAVPLEIGGTLARPTFLPQSVGGIGRSAAGVGTGIVRSPITAIMSIANIGRGRDGPCAAATALAQGQAPPGAPAQQQPSGASEQPPPSSAPVQQQPSGASSPIDRIGRGIRGIFRR
jgi:uncharacterized protein involved in outer membrane biogenesis